MPFMKLPSWHHQPTDVVHDFRFSFTEKGLVSGEINFLPGPVVQATKLAVTAVRTIRSEKLFLLGGVRALGLRFLMGMEKSQREELKKLFGEAYGKIQKDSAFADVGSAVRYFFRLPKDQGHAFAYVPNGAAEKVSVEGRDLTPIVFLHGFGGNLLWNLWALKTEFPDRVILAPSCGFAWPRDRAEDTDKVLRYLDTMLSHVEKTFGVSVKRPWLIGLSAGGQVGFDIANCEPGRKRFRGYVSIASDFGGATEPSFPATFPILMLNGTDDTDFSINNVRHTYNDLRQLGANIELHEMKGANHFFFLSRRAEMGELIREFLQSA